MLSQIDIRDIVLIETLNLEFGDGLHVFTGETGAGKSVLLDALSLALGARGDGALVRTGCSEGRVSAVFRVDHDSEAARIVAQHALSPLQPDADGKCELILRRLQNAQGSTRSFVNDEPVRVATLAQIGRSLLEIHAQHSARTLLEPSAHRDALDNFAGNRELAAATETAYNNWRAAEELLEQVTAEFAAAERERDYIAHASEELSLLAPQAGEELDLMQQRTIISRSEDKQNALMTLDSSLSGGRGVIATLAHWLARHTRPGAAAMPAEVIDAVEGVLAQSEVLHDLLESHLAAATGDAADVERIDARLSELHSMARKYRVAVDELAQEQERFAEQLAALERQEDELANLRQQSRAALNQYNQCAAELSARRREAAELLQQKVSAELPALRLGHVRFVVDISPHSPEVPRRGGNERVVFLVATISGAPLAPLGDIVSGGELSRIMLALRSVLGNSSPATTMVFDEIDTGVGGAVAEAIGNRLAAMARDTQAIVVSHLAQIAARAHRHYLIAKTITPHSSTHAEVVEVHGEERVMEIARMISGQEISAEMIDAARHLLKEAAH